MSLINGSCGAGDPAESDLELTLLEAALMTKEDSRYIGGILLKWKTKLLDAETHFSPA